MRREAVNTFNEGLIMDLNPLTTPSNVMTSCLNGTIITYNGNEFVLLNDMGNGRVETAYLPSGYVPIGVKEHGGIVYVASYNPLTNKALLGSFPSPERNISSNEVSLADKHIRPSDFVVDNAFSTTYKLNLFKGAEDLVLRSGDRFSIIISGGRGPSDLRKNISNYLNTTGTKITSPKNKALTLKACIIDANNNLRDITPQLKRVDVEGESYDALEFKNDVSQAFKENTGFYALPSLLDTEMDLDEYRKNKALNVYNNKVFGELYIVATLNSILRVDFTITGNRNGDKADLKLMLTYYYNCPDGFYDYIARESRYSADLYDKYECIYGKSEDFAHNNLIKGYTFSLEGEPDVQSPFVLNNVENVEYLEDDNLYKVTTILDVSNIQIQNDNDVRAYSVLPAMTYGELVGLTVNGTINLSRLGSGDMILNNWKYFCTLDIITLTWGFEAYLREGLIIESLQFEFYNAETKTLDYVYSPTKKYSYNGSFTDVIGYSNTGSEKLEYGKLYLVIIRCKSNMEIADGRNEKVFARWLLTTSLYNELYFSILDYMNLDNLNNDSYTGLNDVDFDLDYTIKEVSNDPSTLVETYTPNLLSLADLLMMGYKINSKQLLTQQTLKYKHADKYPFTIPSNRYSFKYNAGESSVKWDGIVGGNGETPDSIDLSNISTSQSDWAKETFDVKKNVVVVQTFDDGRIIVRYKALSYILGKKFPNLKLLTYTKVLTKYGSRMNLIIGGSIQSGTTPPFAILLIFRERLRSGHRDYHGYGYFPIKYDTKWNLLRNESSYANYITRRKDDKTITYYASQDWTTFITEGVKDVLGINPIIIFMTFNTFTTTANDYFDPWKGHFKKGSTSIKSIALWYNGQDYGMINGYNTSLTGSNSTLSTLLNDLNLLYIRKTGEEVLLGYLVDPDASSYVRGGSFRISADITMQLKTNNGVLALPTYLSGIANTVLSILGNLVSQEVKDRLVELMTFKVNESASLSIPILFDDLLVDMQSQFSGIRLISETPIIDTPVVFDDDTIYQFDNDGFAINEFLIYTKSSNQMCLASQVSGIPKKYSDALIVKQLNNEEYHLVPKQFAVGSPKIDAASEGSNDSNSILDFSGIKMVNLQIGNTLM